MRSKSFLVVFFAVVAILAAASLYFSATIDKSVKTITAVTSPDGKYKAVKVTLAGGGTLPFCFDTISVLLAAYPDNFVELKKAYEVYAAPCDALPRIEWQSATALQISYAPGSKITRSKEIDVTKSVHVIFATRAK